MIHLVCTSPTISHFICSASTMQDRTASQRWGSNNLHPGSPFHELVAVPTLLPSAERPFELPGMRPGTSALDNLPWARPMLRSMRVQAGTYVVTSRFSQLRRISILGVVRDEPTPGLTPQIPPCRFTPQLDSASSSITNDLQDQRATALTPNPRIRFIEPIAVTQSPFRAASPHFDRPPTPPAPAQQMATIPDSQLTEVDANYVRSSDDEGTFIYDCATCRN